MHFTKLLHFLPQLYNGINTVYNWDQIRKKCCTGATVDRTPLSLGSVSPWSHLVMQFVEWLSCVYKRQIYGTDKKYGYFRGIEHS